MEKVLKLLDQFKNDMTGNVNRAKSVRLCPLPAVGVDARSRIAMKECRLKTSVWGCFAEMLKHFLTWGSWGIYGKGSFRVNQGSGVLPCALPFRFGDARIRRQSLRQLLSDWKHGILFALLTDIAVGQSRQIRDVVKCDLLGIRVLHHIEIPNDPLVSVPFLLVGDEVAHGINDQLVLAIDAYFFGMLHHMGMAAQYHVRSAFQDLSGDADLLGVWLALVFHPEVKRHDYRVCPLLFRVSNILGDLRKV
jgi:hypothetical protein